MNKYIDPKKLKKLYSDKKLSIQKIGKIFDVHFQTISYNLKKHKIPIRDKKERDILNSKNIDPKALYEMYCIKEMSTHRIAKILKVDPTTVFRYLKKNNIQTRSLKIASKISGKNKRIKIDKEQVISLALKGYCIYEIYKEISKGTKLCYETLYNFIKKNNIDTPPTSKYAIEKLIKRSEKDIDNDLIIFKYWDEGKTFEDISKEINMSPGGASLRLLKLGIPVRHSRCPRNKEFYESHPELWNKRRRGLHTNIEKAFIEWAIRKGVKFVTQKQIKEKGHRYDFHIINTNILIETDGDHWHKTDKQKEKDAKWNVEAEVGGFVLLRFKECDIYRTKGECFDIIMEKLQ